MASALTSYCSLYGRKVFSDLRLAFPASSAQRSSPPLVCLQVKAFEEFLDFIQGEDKLDSKYYEVAASLMQRVSGSFNYEQQFQTTFLEEVQKLLPPAVQVRMEHAISDATIEMVINGQICHLANWEFKERPEGDYLRSNPTEFSSFTVGSQPLLSNAPTDCHRMPLLASVWSCLEWKQCMHRPIVFSSIPSVCAS